VFHSVCASDYKGNNSTNRHSVPPYLFSLSDTNETTSFVNLLVN